MRKASAQWLQVLWDARGYDTSRCGMQASACGITSDMCDVLLRPIWLFVSPFECKVVITKGAARIPSLRGEGEGRP